ncbi:hypothetical protein [Priestia sp. P5]|uniref:hypothetical protein n=1 Tax=Priestia sp. P5 TaxID=2917806 RepID=UPI002404CCD5|nr:hypothetical protein [Priestia sp. P5]MDG0058405.1 hypothetical protein [Priestia sp. P5]
MTTKTYRVTHSCKQAGDFMYSPYSGSGLYYGHYGEAPHSHPIQTILAQYWHETHYPGPHKKYVHVYYLNPSSLHYYPTYRRFL